DVHVRRRDLAKASGGDVNESEALFEEGVLDLASFRGFGDERTGGARGVLSVKDGDRFAIGRPAGRREKALHFREALGGAAQVRNIKLKLAWLYSIGQKCDLFAIGRPCDATFGSRN